MSGSAGVKAPRTFWGEGCGGGAEGGRLGWVPSLRIPPSQVPQPPRGRPLQARPTSPSPPAEARPRPRAQLSVGEAGTFRKAQPPLGPLRKREARGGSCAQPARQPAGQMTKFGSATCHRLPFMVASWAEDVAAQGRQGPRAGDWEGAPCCGSCSALPWGCLPSLARQAPHCSHPQRPGPALP